MKNKAQKNGYKHTLQKRFLTLLLVSIILASGMIGGAGIASAQRVINEDSSQIMNLLCEQKASEINLMLKEIASSVDMDYSYVSRRLSQDRSMWNDTEYMEDYMQHVHDELDNTARNTSAAVSIYMRLNPHKRSARRMPSESLRNGHRPISRHTIRPTVSMWAGTMSRSSRDRRSGWSRTTTRILVSI
jgi:hypothetical protein